MVLNSHHLFSPDAWLSCDWLHGMGARYLCFSCEVSLVLVTVLVMLIMIMVLMVITDYVFMIFICSVFITIYTLFARFVDGEMLWTYSVITLGFRWDVTAISFSISLFSLSPSSSSSCLSSLTIFINNAPFSLFFSGLLGWVGGASESPCLVRF